MDTLEARRLRGRRWGRMIWLALIVWQTIWLLALPEPLGKRSIEWTLLTVLPLLLPLRGLLRLEARGMIWGGYLALFAAMFGFMEAWAAPAQRPAASLQLLLCLAFLYALFVGTRKPSRQRRGNP